jgi:aspartyl-tRNA(Asn)/glutamyl-tRNA(Gln) amidotransferase subunit A
MNGTTNCVAAVRFYLDAIEAKKHLNCFVEVFADEALQRAAELDALPVTERKKLHGVVVGIKDNICFKDHKVTAASAILENFTSLFSATAVERLLAAGAIIIGRQNCDEFAMGSTNENSVYGRTLNPVDKTKVTGGSSGGSAAAVKADLCMVSLGSDTGGSVRQPADFCGVTGFKPTYGAVSRHGLIAYGSSFDQIGILANNIPDVELVFDVIRGADNFDSTSININSNTSTKKRLCYFKETLQHPSLDYEIKKRFEKYFHDLREKGFEITAIDFKWLDHIVPTYYVLTTAEASSNLGRYDGIKFGASVADKSDELTTLYKKNRTAGFGAEVKRRIMLGTFVLSAGYYDAYFTQAQKVRALISEHTEKIFNNFDFIISPTVPATAFEPGMNDKDPIEVYLADIYTVYANLTGIPAISVPLFKHSTGLPFGLQLMAQKGNDLSLLSLSGELVESSQAKN